MRYPIPASIVFSVCAMGCYEPVDFDVEVSDNPSLVLEKIFSVELSQEAQVAIRCTRDDEQSEVHLVESPKAAMAHTMRVAGLVAETDYTCDIAAIDVPLPSSTTVQITTGALPDEIPSATGESFGDPGAAYTLVPHQRFGEGDLNIRLVLMDNDGEVRWYYPIPTLGYADMGAEYYGDGMFLWGGISGSGEGEGAPRLVNISHDEVWRADYRGADTGLYHHHAEQQYDGTIVTLVDDHIRAGEDEWTGFAIHQVDVKSDELVWAWSVQEALDNGDLIPNELNDWSANWAGIMLNQAGEETMVVSLCESYVVLGVNMESGELDWTLGPEGELELTDGRQPNCQHGLDIRDQHLLMYDNGAAPTTRAVEFEVEPGEDSFTQTWAWTEDGWREQAWGDVDYLGHDRVVIGRGHLAGWGEGEGPSQVVEVDTTNDEVVWRLSFSDERDAFYAADRIGGCELFGDVSRCHETAVRLAELSQWFDRDALTDRWER